jgi:hypothetical protein
MAFHFQTKNIALRMNRIVLLLSLIGFSFSALNAQKYSNEFLTIGISARAQAMGNAVTAQVNDVTAGYWNPAGLVGIDSSVGVQVAAMHAEWFAGIGKYDYLGVSLPLANAKGRVGISAIRFGIDGIPNTLTLYEEDGTVNYDNIVEFSAADYGFLGSYAREVMVGKTPLHLGGSIKVVHRTIGRFARSWGFGLDLGVQYHPGNWRFGLMGRDLSSTFNAWTINFTEEERDVLISTGNDLPEINSLEVTRPQLILGVGYDLSWRDFSFHPEINAILTTDGRRNTLVSGDPISLDPAAGIEVGYKGFVFFRAGVNQLQEELRFAQETIWTARPSLGVGLKLSRFYVDYAYTDLGDSQNRYSHVISLMVDFYRK